MAEAERYDFYPEISITDALPIRQSTERAAYKLALWTGRVISSQVDSLGYWPNCLELTGLAASPARTEKVQHAFLAILQPQDNTSDSYTYKVQARFRFDDTERDVTYADWLRYDASSPPRDMLCWRVGRFALPRKSYWCEKEKIRPPIQAVRVLLDVAWALEHICRRDSPFVSYYIKEKLTYPDSG